jgi:hypothetical protein
MKTVNLEYDFQTNGETIPAGKQELPIKVAEDLERRQEAFKRYESSLVKEDKVNAAQMR